ncbi:limbin-like, partial [Erinaceus europaeus]|uniref:Limbin-like n=1 Tax=Erinaceus europaeus TaxID=9365 RepID=A0ABM3WW08_ERIEU
GDSFSVSYTASLEPGSLGDGESLQLPALLLFQSRTQNRTQLVAPFTVTAEEQTQVLPSHGLHAAAFLGVLLLFLVLTWVSGVLLIRRRCWTGDLLFWRKARSQEHRLEQSQLTSEADLEEDLALSDQMVGVLCSEDPGGMLQALEELEIATLRRADAALEACRTQVSKDIIGLLLRGLASKSQLSPQAEGALADAFQKQFLWLDREIREEHGRKVVALVAEAELEAQKRMERQQQREMAASEGLEKLLRHADERQASECSALLRTLQGLEQEQLRRSLALQQEEDSAQSRRQLAVLQRTELHRIFFTQIQGAVRKGGLQPQAAEELLRDYSRAQEALEEALDVLQATQRSHLSQRFDHREGLVLSIQSLETRVQGVLDAASAQLTLLIQKHERAGYLDGEQAGALLECTHTEVFAIKQKLEQEQKQQREKLQRQLVVRHRREMVQMVRAARAATHAEAGVLG